jgi:hypothetical protein
MLSLDQFEHGLLKLPNRALVKEESVSETKGKLSSRKFATRERRFITIPSCQPGTLKQQSSAGFVPTICGRQLEDDQLIWISLMEQQVLFVNRLIF